MSETVLDVGGVSGILCIWRREVQVGRHCLRLASTDAQQLGQIAQDEQTGPARHRPLGVTVIYWSRCTSKMGTMPCVVESCACQLYIKRIYDDKTGNGNLGLGLGNKIKVRVKSKVMN